MDLIWLNVVIPWRNIFRKMQACNRSACFPLNCLAYPLWYEPSALNIYTTFGHCCLSNSRDRRLTIADSNADCFEIYMSTWSQHKSGERESTITIKYPTYAGAESKRHRRNGVRTSFCLVVPFRFPSNRKPIRQKYRIVFYVEHDVFIAQSPHNVHMYVERI